MAENAPADEEELKLELTADDADLLAASGLFTGHPAAVRQESTYFDTPDHALAGAGLSLRIRRSGRRRVQTVKAGKSAAGMLVRTEWEREVSSDLPVIDGETPVAELLGAQAAMLAPVFVVENQRRIWKCEGIEIALDRGRIVAGERTTPLCEVELERKDGDPRAVFALARRIDAIAPARICVLSKAERGYRLLGRAGKAIKAGEIALDRRMTAGQSFQTIAGACFRQFHRNVSAILDHADAAAVHQARVAIRRLRSALAIYNAVLDDEQARARFNRELRWLAGKLGDAREIDVLISHVGNSAVLGSLVAARGRAYAMAASALRSRRCRALMLDLAEWIAAGNWLSRADNARYRDQPLGQFAALALSRRRKVLKKRARHFGKLDDPARHEVRKAAKKMRYAADFFASLYYRKRVRHRRQDIVRALEAVQDSLGALNDLATTPQVLERLGLAQMPEAQALAGAHDRDRLLAAAGAAMDDFKNARRFWP